jgi:hypothetical protein
MIARLPLLPQLPERQDERIDFPAERRLLWPQQGGNPFERQLRIRRDHHDVDIAFAPLLASDERAENERDGDLVAGLDQSVA